MKIFEMEMENALKGIYAEVKHTNKMLETRFDSEIPFTSQEKFAEQRNSMKKKSTISFTSQEKFAERRNSMKKKSTHTLINYEHRKYEVMKDVFTNTIVRMLVNPDDVADEFIERALVFSEKAADMFIERLKAGGEKR